LLKHNQRAGNQHGHAKPCQEIFHAIPDYAPPEGKSQEKSDLTTWLACSSLSAN